MTGMHVDHAPAVPPPARRDILLAMLGLPVVLAACRSGAPHEESVADLNASLRARLVELANDPQEAEQLRSIYGAIEQTTGELITMHLANATEFEGLLRDRSVATGTIATTVEEHVEARAKVIERLLSLQDQVKSALGRERWAQLVDAMNDPDRMAQIVGRSA